MNRTPTRLQRLVAFSLLTFLVPPPIAAAPAKPRVKQESATRRTAPPNRTTPAKPEPVLDDLPLIAGLTQFENGPGVLVCEPVPAEGTDAATIAFSTGCARWIHLVVGGQKEFEKTPLWSSVGAAQKELKRPDMRLKLPDAEKLPSIIGITHVVLSEVKGGPEACTLTFQAWDLRTKKPVGEAVEITGSRDKIVGGLSEAARTLARSLGAPAPVAPKAPGETADHLELVGKAPWVVTRETGPLLNDLAQISVRWLNPQEPRPMPVLVNLMFLVHGGAIERYPQVMFPVEHLLKEMPTNTLVIAECARQAYRVLGAFKPAQAAIIESAQQNSPHSYLLNLARAYHERANQHFEEGRRYSEAMVRSNTRNPDGWLSLGGSIYQRAHAIRQGKTIDRLTAKELADCEKLYAEWLPFCLKSVELDPNAPLAWLEVSTAAAFLGLEELADHGFETASRLDATNVNILFWGVDLYQPKWLDMPVKLRRAAEAAVAASDNWYPPDRPHLAAHLHRAGFAELADQVKLTDIERGRIEKQFKKPSN